MVQVFTVGILTKLGTSWHETANDLDLAVAQTTDLGHGIGIMSSLTKWMDRNWYGSYEDNWDNLRFRKVIEDQIHPEDRLLDFGAGRGYVATMNFRGLVRHAAGVDVAADVFQNPHLDEAKLIAADGHIPFEDNSFDVVISSNVLEHIDQPERAFAEIARVLRPGGRFIAKTPNMCHYMPLVARLTPTGFHKYFNRLRGRKVEDTFPTVYACNTPGAVRRLAKLSGLEVDKLELWEGRPEYLRMFAPMYLVGAVYERIVNRFSWLARFRAVLVLQLVCSKGAPSAIS